MEIEFNDANEVDTRGTGWFVGYGEWARNADGPALRYLPQDMCSRGLCMKWMFHCKGDRLGEGKPVSEGRTLSIMVSEGGRFRLQFSRSPDFPPDDLVEHVMHRQGQFCVWGAGLHHRWFVDEACTILSVRWTPQQHTEENAAPANT
jgi:hypothetical protein